MSPAILRISLVALVGTTLAACGANSMPIRHFESLTPIVATGDSRPVLFTKLVKKVPAGEHIGTVQTGAACGGARKLYERATGASIRDQQLVAAVNAELQKAGYRVVDQPSSLFESAPEWQAELLLAGAITHLAMNVCYPRAAFGDTTVSSAEMSMEIQWQVFERRSQSVILTATAGGTGKRSRMPNGGEDAYADAVVASLRNVLADARTAAVLRRPSAVAVTEQSPLVVPLVALQDPSAAGSSDLIEYAHSAVVTIPVGRGHGSGFVVSSTGLVLTNAHVVGEGSGSLTVELAGGRRVKGDVLRVDKVTDVALIQIEKGTYAAVPIGSSAGLKVGDPVFAIGTPFDQRFSRTVTKGVVSSIRMQDHRRVIQSDVSIHPGSSGGPLLDDRGRVVGLAQSGWAVGGVINVGLNHFIPIEEAWRALGVKPQITTLTTSELLEASAALPR